MLQNLQKIMYELFKKEPFYALFLQEINIRGSREIPLAGVSFDKKLLKFFMWINPENFNNLKPEHKEGILIHELLHVVHQHLTKARDREKYSDHKIANLAMDMAINQYIVSLPEGSVNVNDWKLEDGTDFPKVKPFEVYYNLIKDTKQTSNKTIFEKYVGTGETLDKHSFDELEDLSEEEKEKITKELKNALERTIEKTAYSHSLVPDYLKDLLKDINTNLENLNYKRVLMQYIRKSLTANERKHTWKRPNKRYGVVAQGTKSAEIPNAIFLADTSGSISHTELNEFLSTIDCFLKVGQKKCFLGLWHTELYNIKKYRTGNRLTNHDVQSGGTDPIPALNYIKKKEPDLAIILTDGYFDLPKKNSYPDNILWIISKNGNQDKLFLSKLPGKYLFIK